MIDMHETGLAERRLVVLAGDKGEYFLGQNPISRVQVAIGTPFIMPGQIEGLGVFDKLRNVQDGKTQSMRQWIDNQNNNNNRRLGVDIKGIQDPDSVYDSKPAGVIKCKRPPQEVIFPIPVDDIGPSCVGLLEYFDKITAQRAGAALDMQTEQQGINSESAHGTERLMSAKELITSMIARNLSETLITQVYRIVHHLIRTELNSPVDVKLNGDWLRSDPNQWMPRKIVTINVGDTPSKKREKYNILTQVLANQLQLKAEGSTLVDDGKVYNTLCDMIALGLDTDSERYYIDPTSQQGQQMSQQAQQMAMQ